MSTILTAWLASGFVTAILFRLYFRKRMTVLLYFWFIIFGMASPIITVAALFGDRIKEWEI